VKENYLQQQAILLSNDTIAEKREHNSTNNRNPAQNLKESRIPPNRIPLIDPKKIKPTNQNLANFPHIFNPLTL